MISERRTARCVRAGAGLSLTWLLISCAYLVPGPDSGGEVHPLAFNHELHIASDLECKDCHAGAAQAEVTKMGMPTLATCLDCHEEDPDEEEAEVVAFLGGIRARPADARWVLYSPAEEIVFTHGVHASVVCAECHGDVAGAIATGSWVKPTMETCIACHEKRAPAHTNCATCHTKIRKDRAPDDHRGNWERIHGQEARFGDLDALLSESCSRCHTRDTCMSCHRQVQPRDHTNHFRIRAHGLMASTDRQTCAACHQQNMCVRCHQSTTPASHRGSFGSARNQHCVSCHAPLGADSCAVCHKGTPSHRLAPPKTPVHPPGANCRQCHDSPATLVHTDNGMDCNACHS